MIWTAALCLVDFVNSIVWAGNVNNPAPVWCDISSQILLGAGIGIPASILCISRRLYRITSVQTASVTLADKRRAVIEDLAIAVGIPIVVLIMHIVVHAHRFDIYEDIGCYPVTYNTLPAYFLYFMWPILIGAVSFIYSVLNLRSFYIRRAQFAQFLSAGSAMNMSRYLRLMILALVDIMFTIPLGAYVVHIGTQGVILRPWISWEDTHFNWLRVNRFPALIWRSDRDYYISMELSRWLGPFCALVFFALFGFASEAQKNYRIAFWWVARCFGYKQPARKNGGISIPKFKPAENKPTGGGVLPLYIITNSSVAQTQGTSTLEEVESPADSLDKQKPFSSPSPSSPPPSYRNSETVNSETSSPSRSFVTLPDTERVSMYSTTSEPRISISSTRSSTSTTRSATFDAQSTYVTVSSRPNPDPHLNVDLDDYSIYARTATPSTVNERTNDARETAAESDLYLRPIRTGDRIYLTDAYYRSTTPQPELPSPPPFNYTAARHSPEQAATDGSCAGTGGGNGGIIITVQQSRSLESL
ncbi:a-factor receptor [Paramarasmius palmivorus]|uniref:A-factor receptor n=1 Tax=Paramarasmius palmivorus TaxID=297713 RepID=A0AAW0D2T5_9AGAR